MKKLTAALLTLLLALSFCACDLIFGGEDPTEAPTEPPAEYTINFELNGGQNVEGVVSTVTVPDGETAVMPIPTKEGCVFAGWYLDAELTDRYFFDFPLDEDVTLYAKFYETALGEYIVISNVEQLMTIKDDPAAKYLLACNINCKGNTLTPIDEFTGELEGNGYKIYNYTISENAVNVALIRTNKGTVKNLSFGDFTFDIKRDSGSDKFYGVVCGINYGTVENCVILDSEMKITCNVSGASYSLYVGGIAGDNYGTVSNCKNNAIINVETKQGGHDGGWIYGWSSANVNHVIGGLVGKNDVDAVLNDGTNNGNINITSETTYFGQSYGYVGGIVGANDGDILSSGSACDFAIIYTGAHANIRLGGAVGNNTASVENCSAEGNINIDDTAGTTETLLGGFVGYTCGKLYNCYSTCDITDNTATIKAIGGFAGYNEKLADREYVIHKCFSTGSISISGTAENVGKFVGLSTGTEKDCCYLDTVTITKTTIVEEAETTEEVTPTNDSGTAKAESELLSADFLENTMYFDRMVWFLAEGELPKLR